MSIFSKKPNNEKTSFERAVCEELLKNNLLNTVVRGGSFIQRFEGAKPTENKYGSFHNGANTCG